MSIEFETIQKGARVYFDLLKCKILSSSSISFQLYIQEEDVREVVRQMATEAGTQIIEAAQRLHLVSKPDSSVFATNFTHLKKKYSQVENKREFHVISMIIVTFLAEIDRDVTIRTRMSHQGMTYPSIEKKVTELFVGWKKRLEEDEIFDVTHSIAMRDIIAYWQTKFETKETKEGTDLYRGNKRTRIGLIAHAMRLLEEERLVYIADSEDIPRAIPKQELFERLEGIYHDDNRYEQLKTLITKHGGGQIATD